MVDVQVDSTRLGARSESGATTTVRVEGWIRRDDEAADFEGQLPGQTVTGYASQLKFPVKGVYPRLSTADRGLPDAVDPEDPNAWQNGYDLAEPTTVSVSDEEYYLEHLTDPVLCLKFRGEAVARRERNPAASDTIVISFAVPTLVSVGFYQSEPDPVETITVPETKEGLATALSWSGAALGSTGPIRAWRGGRDKPPRIEFGDGVEVPESVRQDSLDTGLELRLPDRLDALYPSAPLVYFLGADVELDADATPTLSSRSGDFSHTFSELPDFETDVGSLLAHLFYGELLLSGALKGLALPGTDLFETAGLDPERLADRPLVERIAALLELPQAEFAAVTPDWPFALGVEPALEHSKTVVRWLGRLPAIYTSRSTLEAVRETTTGDNWLQGGLQHPTAWLGEGRTPAACKVVPVSTDDEGARTADTVSLTIVRGSDTPDDETVDLYRQVTDRDDVEVEVIESPSRERLRTAFETDGSFLQYAGKCTEEGLVCTDGVLAPGEMTDVGARVLVLAAPDSHRHALELVRRGGVVALGFDDDPADACPTFGRCLLTGANAWVALQCERAFGDAQAPGTLVGDPTAQSHTVNSQMYDIAVVDDDVTGFTYGKKTIHPDPGYTYSDADISGRGVFGFNYIEGRVDGAAVRQFFEDRDAPILYRDDLYWPNVDRPFNVIG